MKKLVFPYQLEINTLFFAVKPIKTNLKMKSRKKNSVLCIDKTKLLFIDQKKKSVNTDTATRKQTEKKIKWLQIIKVNRKNTMNLRRRKKKTKHVKLIFLSYFMDFTTIKSRIYYNAKPLTLCGIYIYKCNYFFYV